MNSVFTANLDRADTPDKCDGGARYVHDLQVAGMLHAVTVRSSVRRGTITSITVPELPAGYVQVSAADVPGVNQISYFKDPCPFFAPGSVQYRGEAVLLLVGGDPAKLHRLARQTIIEYDEIPAIHTMEEALAGDKPPIFGSDNIYIEERFGHGDVDGAIARAAEVFTTTTETGYQDHLYLEPQGVLACPEVDRMTIYVSSQGPHAARKVVAAALGWDEASVRVIQTTVGGGFGGKIEPPMFLAAQSAVAAHHCGKPVRLIYTREEDLLCTTKRHPSRITVTSALAADGSILAVDIDSLFQGGGYSQSCAMVLDTGTKKASGVYHFPAIRVRGRGLASNNPMPGAFRGFGAPQNYFALETHLNALARKLGREPLEMKRALFIKQGDATITGGRYHFATGLDETISAATEAAGYYRRRKALPAGPSTRRGLGQALVKFGAPNSVDSKISLDSRSIGLRKHSDGRIEILSELVEMGQGLHTAFRKLVARHLDLPVKRVSHAPGDTDAVPFLSITGASMSVVLFGATLLEAADKLKARLDEPGEVTILQPARQPDHVFWDATALRGEPFHSYAWGTFIAEVEVDMITYQVQVVDLWVALDVGSVIDRRLVQGQIEGGAVQGLGFSLLECMPRDGFSCSLTDYLIPTFLDAPQVHGLIVETPYPPGPYGAKCVGEPPLVGVGPAIADAVANACGVEIYQLPITPEYLLQRMTKR
ncbi:xanthine dehydrogenase family protein molybdopterin-binding subunit [Desulfofustis glycolicus]|uniref:CO or xanthine dehydrogenase, Mo-binding subunit n=1 Tax=Desulfofustis glycolicus DSM 9705 TaxID=1121409 RepID=A0A1M5YET7_9BACT|nr:xanthine dehydrogenase family protein molybdopterin-binding subunit [Desulfofustis glycolicus]SHI10560.1 CO or xanthine dehydrogenase, Mo-binding subunit [Desulfofustis glycolicus DSM 9705]